MSIQLFRAGPISFVFGDGRKIVAPPATRGQMREVFALDFGEELSPIEAAEVRGKQVEVFLRNARFLQADGVTSAGTVQDALDQLTIEAEVDIIHAFVAQHHGYLPESAAAIQQAMREIVKKKLTDQISPG